MTYLQRPTGLAETPSSETRRAVSRRSQLEIRMDILRAIMEGAEGPTQIMYKANLSWILLCDHLSALGEQGFVGEKTVGNRKKYSLTGKGIEIVGAYLNLIREIIFDAAGPRPEQVATNAGQVTRRKDL
jgi:predicted transcriptional regulator